MKHFTLMALAALLTIGQGVSAATDTEPDCECKDNPIHNPSFEGSTDFWHVEKLDEHFSFISEDKYEMCGHDNGLLFGHGYIYQDVEVTGDKLITVKVYGGTHDTHDVHKFKLMFFDEHNNEITELYKEVDMDFAVGSGSTLKQFTIEGKSTKDVKYVRFKAYSEGGYFKIDQVCMKIDHVMPVTLTAFNASREGSVSTLQWTTAAETNTSHFDVQHSTDGKNWSVLASVAAAGESKNLLNYSYTHTSPSAANLYRLKMIDLDETFAYSSIRNVNFSDVQLDIYPNPSSDRIRFTSASPVNNVKIFNVNGALVMNAKPDASNELDIRSVAQGIYFLKVNDSPTTKRIVVAR